MLNDKPMKQIKTASEVLMDIVFNDNTKLIEKGISKQDCIHAMQTYAQQFKPEWTAIEDGLPECREVVLVSCARIDGTSKIHTAYRDKTGRWWMRQNWQIWSVTHWMRTELLPLPSLPNQ